MPGLAGLAFRVPPVRALFSVCCESGEISDYNPLLPGTRAVALPSVMLSIGLAHRPLKVPVPEALHVPDDYATLGALLLLLKNSMQHSQKAYKHRQDIRKPGS